MKVKDILLDFIFPRKCMFCGALINDPAACHCRKAVDARYKLIGDSRVFSRRIKGVSKVVSSYRYAGEVPNAVYAFKFHGDGCSLEEISTIMTKDLESFPCLANADVLIAVPSFLNMRKHGDGLAKSLAAKTGIPLGKGIVRKVRYTQKQHEISAEKRKDNLKGAFRATPKAKGLNILVCDDVLTSGATLAELAAALKKAGAGDIFAITFARATK